jgi:putative redox protein
MRTQSIRFPGAGGGQLAARLDLPDGEPAGCALFAHCFTCGKDVVAASRIATRLTDHGLAVMRFDFTGLGGSDGDFANTNFSSNIADLIAAADHLRTTLRPPELLVGHSLGGAAVIAAAGDIPDASAIATIAAPSDPTHVTGLFRDHVSQIEAAGEAEVMLAGRPFRIRRQFLVDAAEHRLVDKIGSLRRALLIMHSPRDITVDIANATQLFTAAKHPKSFVSLDTADHLLSQRDDASYAADVIAAWGARYVGRAGERR